MSSERSAPYATDTIAIGLLDTGKGEYNGYQVISRGSDPGGGGVNYTPHLAPRLKKQ